MNTKRYRKMALYLKYIAFLIDEDCKEYDQRNRKKNKKKDKRKGKA